MKFKGIILAAGEGKRLYPLSNAIPKEMIRVGDKPAIEHVIKLLKAGDISNILVVINRKKGIIIEQLGSGERLGVNLTYKVQEKAEGTAKAVLIAEEYITDNNFVVIYGDNYFKPYKSMKELIGCHVNKKSDVTIALYRVTDPTQYGIVKMDSSMNIIDIIEKPTLDVAKTYKTKKGYYAIAGLILFNNGMFQYIKNTKIGILNEMWLTDSIDIIRKQGHKVKGFILEGVRYDIGTYNSLIEADMHEIQEIIKKGKHVKEKII